jgi:hypothetical protein
LGFLSFLTTDFLNSEIGQKSAILSTKNILYHFLVGRMKDLAENSTPIVADAFQANLLDTNIPNLDDSQTENNRNVNDTPVNTGLTEVSVILVLCVNLSFI